MISPRPLLPLLALGLVTLPPSAVLADSFYRITLGGMDCNLCSKGLEKRLQAIPGTASVRVDHANSTVEITARPGATLDAATLQRAIRDSGYNVRRLDGPTPPR